MSERLDAPGAGAVAVRGGAIRVLGYGVGVLLSVGSAALLFRHLGVEESGRYVLVLSLVTIAVGITEAGLSALGVRELAQRDPAEAPSLLRNLLGLRVALSLAGIAVACGYAWLIGYGEVLLLGTLLAGVAVLLQGVQAVLTVVLQVELRFVAVTVADFIRQAANVAAIVALVFAGAGILPFFAALIFAGLCGLGSCALLLKRATPLLPAFDLHRWKGLLTLALPFALATAIAVVYLRAGLLLVDRLSSERETGFYGVSFRIVEVVSQVPALAVGAAFPILARAARDDTTRLTYGVQRTLDASVVLGGLIAVGLVAGAPVAIAVVGGGGFEPAESVLRWHALAIFGTFLAQPFGFALLASGHTRAVLWQTLAALVVSVGLTIPLASAYGADGAAASAAAAELTLFAAGVLLLRHHGVRVGLGTTARAVLAGGVALLPLLVLPSLAAMIAAGAIFPVLCFVLRVVPDELVDAFRARARPTATPRPPEPRRRGGPR